MKPQKILMISVVAAIFLVLLGITYFVKPRYNTVGQPAPIHYQGPPPGSIPGEGFHGPTGPHP